MPHGSPDMPHGSPDMPHESPDMKVVIAGAGNVGTYLAADLHEAGHEVLLIEIDPAVAARGASLGVEWMVRDACEVSALDAAGLASTDVVVAATGDDEDNLVISLLAKQEFAVPRVVARVNHPKNHWLFNQTWGVDVAVSTPHLLAALVEEAVSVGSLVRLMQLESSGARLVEVTLAPASPAAGTELSRLGMPREATVVAVVRRAHVVVPRGDTVLEPGDEVLVLVSADAEDSGPVSVGGRHEATSGLVPLRQPLPQASRRAADGWHRAPVTVWVVLGASFGEEARQLEGGAATELRGVGGSVQPG